MNTLVFLLLDDLDSKNTINLLYFLNNYINEINNKNYIIDIKLIKKESINTDNFIEFRKKYNIQSIPSIIILDDNNKNTNTISNAKNVGDFLESIINNNDNNQVIEQYQTKPHQQIDNVAANKSSSGQQQNNYDGDSEDDDNYIKDYITKELFNNNEKEDILSSGHNDGELAKKMKEITNKKKIENNGSGGNIKEPRDTPSNNINPINIKNNKTNVMSRDSATHVTNHEPMQPRPLNISKNKKNNYNHVNNLKNRIKQELNTNGDDDDKMISEKFLDELDDE
tara:strand:+ start:1431 stop:2276 length:846 start_codon:yes stop_codon:yes gene_type:complete